MLKFYYSHSHVDWTGGTDAACTLLVLLLLAEEEELSASSCEQLRARPKSTAPQSGDEVDWHFGRKLPCFSRLDPWPMPAILYQYRLKYPGKVPSPLYLLTSRILNPDRLID